VQEPLWHNLHSSRRLDRHLALAGPETPFLVHLGFALVAAGRSTRDLTEIGVGRVRL
jgi:hypothetical protein